MAIIKQIADLINDAVADITGESGSATELDTTDIVSLGKSLSQMELTEKFYGALANRIIKTVYLVRAYERKNRSVLIDEHQYGAFIQKVYAEIPEAVDNPAQEVTTVDERTGARTYKQTSPYDVENVVNIKAKIFGGQGTWSQEFILPSQEFITAFTSDSAMMACIDAIYLKADNAIQLELEALEATAVNTAIASAIAGGNVRNLLEEYNDAHTGHELTVAEALEDLDFLKFAVKEISETADYMERMSTAYNVDGYLINTPKENLVVECLSKFAKSVAYYLQADTFHKDLIALPRYSEIPYWILQGGKANVSFADASSINVKHSDINSGTAVEQSGIICFMHDTENVAAYFGERYTWEKFNERSRVMIHGEQFRKGYAVDNHANALVFVIAETSKNKNKGEDDPKEEAPKATIIDKIVGKNK